MEAVTQSRVWAGRGPGQAEERAFRQRGQWAPRCRMVKGLARAHTGCGGEGDQLRGDVRRKNSKLKIRDRTFLSQFLMK